MAFKQRIAKVKIMTQSFYSNAVKRLRKNKGKISISRRNIIIILSAAIVVLLAAAAGYYYYFYIYMGPNFDDTLTNNVVSSSMEEVEPGDTLNYELNYQNNGYRTVDSLEIEIPIPDYVRLSSFADGGKFDEENKILSYSYSDMEKDASGKISFELKVDEPLDNDTKIEMDDILFIYSIKEDNLEKTIPNNGFHIVKSSPDFSSFSITSTDTNSGLLSIGDEIKYTIKVKNTGNMIARDLEIISRISPFLILSEDRINQSGKNNDGNIMWTLDEMEPGDLKTFTFYAELGADDLNDKEEIITSAAVIYEGSEVNNGETTEIARLFPDFSESTANFADANGGGYLWAGETVNVTVTITNTGQRKADDYQLYCPIPAQATYVSQSGTSDGIRWDDDIRGLIWDLSGLEVGESRDIIFKMTVNNDYYYKSTTISSEFHIMSGEDDFPVEPASIYIQGHPYLNVVAMGDSLIAKSDWVQRLDSKLEAAYPAADYNTTASAISGEMSFEGLARYDSTVGPLRPTILIVAYGSNDVGISASYFSYSIDNIIAKAKGQGATVFINTVGPDSYAGKEDWPRYNDIIRQVANKHGIPVINVTSPLSQNTGKYLYDGLHYSSAGAEVVAQTVFNSIVPYLNGLGGRR